MAAPRPPTSPLVGAKAAPGASARSRGAPSTPAATAATAAPTAPTAPAPAPPTAEALASPPPRLPRSLPVHYILTDPKQNVTYVNSSFEEFTGFSLPEVVGRKCTFLQGEETSPEEIAEMREAVRSKRATSVVVLNYTKRGHPFWNVLSIRPVFYAGTETLKGYIGEIFSLPVASEELGPGRRPKLCVDDVIALLSAVAKIPRALEDTPSLSGTPPPSAAASSSSSASSSAGATVVLVSADEEDGDDGSDDDDDGRTPRAGPASPSKAGSASSSASSASAAAAATTTATATATTTAAAAPAPGAPAAAALVEDDASTTSTASSSVSSLSRASSAASSLRPLPSASPPLLGSPTRSNTPLQRHFNYSMKLAQYSSAAAAMAGGASSRSPTPPPPARTPPAEQAAGATAAGAAGAAAQAQPAHHFVAETLLPTRMGRFRVRAYRDESTGAEPLALIVGDVENTAGVLCRVHDQCQTSEVFGSLKCDCKEQLELAMQRIQADGGMVIYLPQEGRGIGLANKVAAYAAQEMGLDTVDANRHLGLPDDAREYDAVRDILADLNVSSLRLMTNNPRKVAELSRLGIKIDDRVPIITPPNSEFSAMYVKAKAERMAHMF